MSRLGATVRGLLAVALVLSALGGSAVAKGPRAAVPAGFFGVVPQGPLTGSDWARMGALGLTDRFQILWPEVEPVAGTFDWSGPDATIGEAAAHGVRVMPVLYGSPAWLRPEAARPPLGATGLKEWSRFVRAAVRRYGPDGSFWRGRARRLPIRRWQIWNEPNYILFWRPQPSPAGYVALLRASSRAIHGLDPQAMVVAAGLAPIEHAPPPWEFLRAMYEVRGSRWAFDAAALHPYATSLGGLLYSVNATRTEMVLAGDGRKPLLVTEVGVSSAGESPFDLGPTGQARFLAQGLSTLAAKRRDWRIGGVYWYAWADSREEFPGCPFCDDSGLFGVNGEPKPAWTAMRRVVGRWQG
jgi:hypothetical protein